METTDNQSGMPAVRVLSIAGTIREGLKSVAARVLSNESDNPDAVEYLESYRNGVQGLLDDLTSMEKDVLAHLDHRDIRILWLVLTSSVDPEAGVLMDAASGESCQGTSDVEVLESLECISLEDRLAFRRRMMPDSVLLKEGWCRVNYSITGRLQLSPGARGKALFFSNEFQSMAVEEIAEQVSHPPERRLSDLVLSSSVLEEVTEVVEAARGREIALAQWGFAEEFSRGLAISALFDGEPGTGKTLSAEVLAGELGRPLQRVNVARILDKYVGGTQKNIEAAFEEASRTGSVLLFDEADALFAKRLNVESSQDRHANLEINLLLEWMERFDGVVVLTTNLRQGIDKAFERRIGYKVHFPFPGIEEREALWKRLIPDQTPVTGQLDFSLLAETYELSGGSIKNALLRAAYKSASRGEGLTQEALQEAAERECVASGKLVHSPSAQGGMGFSI